jgi:hypothetical protein
MGGEGTVVQEKVDPRPGHQGGEFLDQLAGREEDGPRTVTPRPAQLQEHVAVV